MKDFPCVAGIPPGFLVTVVKLAFRMQVTRLLGMCSILNSCMQSRFACGECVNIELIFRHKEYEPSNHGRSVQKMG